MGIFDHTIGQDLAVSILRRALAGDAQHTYLFTGPIGVGKGDMALEFAAGLICTRGGCGECEACDRVRQGIHPDVEVVRPEGPLIRIGQIRELNVQLVQRPFEGRASGFILLQSDAMNDEAADAILRSLEEPSPHIGTWPSWRLGCKTRYSTMTTSLSWRGRRSRAECLAIWAR